MIVVSNDRPVSAANKILCCFLGLMVCAFAESAGDGFFGKMVDAINSNNPHTEVAKNAEVAEMHARAEVFKSETEEVFRYLQVTYFFSATLLLSSP
jgi:ABC-type lipoprotein release transport system permease subunit